jgi:hypothetical protein
MFFLRSRQRLSRRQSISTLNIFLRTLACFVFLPLLAQDAGQVERGAQAQAAADLRARIEATPTLPFDGVHFALKGPAINWKSGMVSWLAVDPEGIIYEILRGEVVIESWFSTPAGSSFARGVSGTTKFRIASASIPRETYGPWTLVLPWSSNILGSAKS